MGWLAWLYEFSSQLVIPGLTLVVTSFAAGASIFLGVMAYRVSKQSLAIAQAAREGELAGRRKAERVQFGDRLLTLAQTMESFYHHPGGLVPPAAIDERAKAKIVESPNAEALIDWFAEAVAIAAAVPDPTAKFRIALSIRGALSDRITSWVIDPSSFDSQPFASSEPAA